MAAGLGAYYGTSRQFSPFFGGRGLDVPTAISMGHGFGGMQSFGSIRGGGGAAHPAHQGIAAPAPTAGGESWARGVPAGRMSPGPNWFHPASSTLGPAHVMPRLGAGRPTTKPTSILGGSGSKQQSRGSRFTEMAGAAVAGMAADRVLTAGRPAPEQPGLPTPSGRALGNVRTLPGATGEIGGPPAVEPGTPPALPAGSTPLNTGSAAPLGPSRQRAIATAGPGAAGSITAAPPGPLALPPGPQPTVGAPAPSTRSVRGRRSSFNPNQGSLF